MIRLVSDLADGNFCTTHEMVYEQNWIGCLNYQSYKIMKSKDKK